jgi:hypothetical protein
MPGPANEEPAAPDPAASLTAAFTSYTGNSRFLDCFYRQENAVTRRFDRALDRLLALQERRDAIAPREIRVQWVAPRKAEPSALLSFSPSALLSFSPSPSQYCFPVELMIGCPQTLI